MAPLHLLIVGIRKMWAPSRCRTFSVPGDGHDRIGTPITFYIRRGLPLMAAFSICIEKDPICIAGGSALGMELQQKMPFSKFTNG